MTFKEKRELEALPGRIEALETEKQELFDAMASPTFHTMRGEEITDMKERLEAVEGELAAAYERWVELEEIAGSSAG